MRRFKTQLNLVRAALTLLVMMLTAATAWAETQTASYIDADGIEHTVTATVLTGGAATTLSTEGWYVVNSDITYTYQIYLSANVNLILADGCTMNVGTSDNGLEIEGIYGNATLTIYGQTLGTGTLSIYTASIDANCIDVGALTINGGHIIANSDRNSSTALSTKTGDITINGGTVTATTTGSNSKGIYTAKIFNFTGGKLTVDAAQEVAIHASGCQYNFTWRNFEDQITIGSTGIYAFNNNFHVNFFRSFTDGTNIYSGTLSGSEINVLKGKTLTPYYANDYAETGTNEYTIYTATGWDLFCDMIESGESFSGKTVKLGADISITRAAGSSGHEFMGTFDGDYHTLTVNITDTTTQGTAPFREIRGATIRKLITTGSVNGTLHAAGLVGYARGDASVTNTIENCKVATNVTVTTAINGNYHCGGVVGHALNSTLNISNTVYCGAISNSGNYVGGFQGWSDGNTVNLSNCLFTGSYEGGGVFHPMAVRNRNAATTATVNNAFYNATPTLTNAQFIAANGTKTVGVATIPATLGSEVEALNFMTVYEDGILFDGLYYASPVLSTDSDGAFVINNASDWEYFCEDLQDNDTWNRFSGKTVKLGADISVTRMAGSSGHDFCGMFDGDHHKLTFTSTEDVNGVAPFSYISTTLANPDDAESSPASIKNLNVVCDITTAATHASGLVGRAWGVLNIEGCTVSGTITTSDKYACGFIGEVNCSPANITNCRSSITVISNVEGDGTHGGFVGRTTGNSSLNIEGSIFDGKLLTTGGTTNCGGFVGWRATNAPLIKNCLYAPSTPAEGETWVSDENSATLCRNDATITNCYFTDTLGVVQGKQAHSITAGEGVTVGFSGTATEYGTSGITAYGTGIMYNGVLYAGINDEVSLNLDGSANGYSVNAGTLTGEENPFTLLMPDENVTISAAAQFQRGDVNQDGNITIADVTTLIDYLLSNDSAIPAEADVNSDDNVSIADVTALIDYLLSGTI